MPKPLTPFVRVALANASEMASTRVGAWTAPVRAVYTRAGAAYAPYISLTEKALRYGTMGMAVYTYGNSKYQQYQERGDAVWSDKLGADEVHLAGGLAGFSLGFIRVSSVVKGFGAATGIGSTASSAAAAASVTATKELVLGKDVADVALASSGKALEKYSHLAMKVVAKAEEIRSGLNPINHAPKATMVVSESLLQKHSSAETYRTSEEEGASMLSEVSSTVIGHLLSMKEQLRELRADNPIMLQEKIDEEVVQQSTQMKL